MLTMSVICPIGPIGGVSVEDAAWYNEEAAGVYWIARPVSSSSSFVRGVYVLSAAYALCLDFSPIVDIYF